MADLEADIFADGAAPDAAPPPDVGPSSPEPSASPQPSSQDNRAISDAISALRGPVLQYGTQPQPAPAQPPPTPPNPDDQPVTGGVLRQLLEERQQRQRLEAQVRDHQAREAERNRQAAQPKTEDLLFQDPEGFKRQLVEEQRKEIAHMRLETDMQMTAMRHGPMFDAAWQHFHASCQNGADPVSYFRVMNSRSPGEEMVRWFNERRVMHEVGGDINGYRQRVAQQLLQDPEFLAHVQQQMQNGGSMPPPQQQRGGQPVQPRGEDGRFQPAQQPRQEVRLPSSLSRLNGASRGTAYEGAEDGSEEAIFDAGRPRKN